ncbi:MAG: hypothetical protein ABW127_09890 [Candidatus Thiodiazotropha endolucinida]
MNTDEITINPQRVKPQKKDDAEKTPADKQDQLIKLFGLVEDDARELVANHAEDVDYVLEKIPSDIIFKNLKISDASFTTLPPSPPSQCYGLLMNQSEQALFMRTLSRGLFLLNTKQFKLFFDTSCKFLTNRGSSINSDSLSFSGNPKTLPKGYTDLVKISNLYYGPNFTPSDFRIAICGNKNLKNGQRQSFGSLGMPWLYMDSTMIPAVGLVMHEIMHTIGENHSLEQQDVLACNNVPYLVQNILSTIDVYDQFGNLHPILNAQGGTDYRKPILMGDGSLSEVIPSDRGLVGYFFNNTIPFSKVS